MPIRSKIRTPTKKPKGGQLTEEQKAENKQIARERIYVGHGIRRVEGYRLLGDEYRLATGLLAMIAAAVVGLIEFADLMNEDFQRTGGSLFIF